MFRLTNICRNLFADYNRRFAVVPGSEIDFHRSLDETQNLDFLFAIPDFRKNTKTLQINYAGKAYQINTKLRA